MSHDDGNLAKKGVISTGRGVAEHRHGTRGRKEQPDRILRVVVFPAPFGPRKPTTSPAPISKEMPSTARRSRVWRRQSPRIEPPRAGLLLVVGVGLDQIIDDDGGHVALLSIAPGKSRDTKNHGPTGSVVRIGRSEGIGNGPGQGTGDIHRRRLATGARLTRRQTTRPNDAWAMTSCRAVNASLSPGVVDRKVVI